MLKNFELVHAGGQTSSRCAVNTAQVLWVMGARKEQIGKTIIGVCGNGSIAIKESIDDVIRALGVDLVKLLTHDRAGRPGFAHDIYVTPVTISVTTRALADEFDTIKFVDGTELDVKDAQGLIG